MDGQKKKRGVTIPWLLRQAIIQDYLSGRKSSYMLSIEYGVDQKNINKMVHRYQQKNGTILAESITIPIMGRKKKQQEDLSLKLEDEELRRQLKLANSSLKVIRSWVIFYKRSMVLTY